MKFATSRQSGKFALESTEPSDTVWLRRGRVGAKRPGDFLVVVLSAGVILTLGLVVVIARFESSGAEPASRLATVQQPVMRAAPSAQPASPPVAVASAPAAQQSSPALQAAPAQPAAATPAPYTGGPVVTAVAPRPATPTSTASVPTPPAAVTPAPITQPIEVSRQAPPRGGARFDPALAFAAPTFPTGEMPAELESLAASEATSAPEAEPVQQTARLAETPEPQPARREAAQPTRQPSTNVASTNAASTNAGEPVAKKGAAGATWAVYFDQFPDQSTAASRIGALQGKYGPHLGGRTLTYTRTGGDWRLRVSGLTEDAARGICDKVKSAGSNCAVGGR